MLTIIILAAGLSRRMGIENKLLLPFQGKTIVETTIDNLLAAQIGEIIVVVGHESEKVKAVLQNYPLPKESGQVRKNADLTHFLIENKEKNKSYVCEATKKDAKRAEMSYVLRGASDRYQLLEITLKTGRHHQIRAQLSAIGCPIKGDVKYGARRANKDRSIHLHAWKLSFLHPILKKKIDLTAELPDDVLWQFFNKTIAA